MTIELYKLLLAVTLILQFICIILCVRVLTKSNNKFGWVLIIIGVAIIFVIQLQEFLSLDQISVTMIERPLFFEYMSFASSILLIITLGTILSQQKELSEKKVFEIKPELKPFAPTTPKTFVPSPAVETKESYVQKIPSIPSKEKIERIWESTPLGEKQKVKEEKPDYLKKELEKVTAQRDKLVSIISHDLRTPLNSVFGFCQLLRDRQYKDQKEIKKFAENIYDLSKQQLNALNKILDWTRVESKDLRLNPTEFDVSSTINFVAKSFAKIAQTKKIKIIVNSKPHLLVFADEFMIIEVLKNLLENSIKFSPNDSNIEINTHYHEKLNKLVVLVCDSGIGINREVMMNLLSASNKFIARGTKGEKGIGLGLVICKAIMDKHGEYIWISSEEGKWTRVYFTLKPATENV